MSPLTANADIEVRVRAEVYAFASSAVRYPQEPVNCGILNHVRFDDESLEEARADMVAVSTDDVTSLQAAHRVLFPAVESQDAPAYETAYSQRDVFRQAHVMADVAGFYNAHGLLVGGSQKDRPDGLGPELEFMGFLAAKQAHAFAQENRDGVELCLDSQRSFLRDHLGGWGPEYGRRMAAVSDHEFYDGFGRFLTAWLDSDMDRLGVVPTGVDEINDGISGDEAPVPDPIIGWDDQDCLGAV